MLVVLILLIIVALIGFSQWSNSSLQLTEYCIKSNKLNDTKNLCIVHLSDLHNKLFGVEQERLLMLVTECKPDVIVFTGDIVDNAKYDNVLVFLKYISGIAPVYYVPGNHEYMAGNYDELEPFIASAGIEILRNKNADINVNGFGFSIFGVDDPYIRLSEKNNREYMKEQLDRLPISNTSGLNILLSHRPELFDIYDEYDFDIVMCGHAHGGQFRLFNRGIIAPNQGLLPQYFQGVHRGKRVIEVISRGLGNSVVPLRINNRPEVVKIVLSGDSDESI